MSIRWVIQQYLTLTAICLMVLFSLIVYWLFAEYREEEFQQRQKEKISYTVELLTEYKQLSENLTALMDKHTIHDFYDEKLMVFDRNKSLVYSSIDDLPIYTYQKLLNELSPANQWIETKEADYDIVAVYIETDNTHYYAISKAYDAYGYSKLRFLRNVLLTMVLLMALVIMVLGYFVSQKLARPLLLLTRNLPKQFRNGTLPELLLPSSYKEIDMLVDNFNQLIRRTNEAFDFQRHSIHHISHQLKTPISVLVSELERIRYQTQDAWLQQELSRLLINTKALGEVVQALLEIAKIESGNIQKQLVRIDELIFDLIGQLNVLYPDFRFEIYYCPDEFEPGCLELWVNPLLMQQAFQNLLLNAIYYSSQPYTEVYFYLSPDCSQLRIVIANVGATLDEEEQKRLFKVFLRGKNSHGKTGFGLGLVLTKRILELHGASIHYIAEQNKNRFEVLLNRLPAHTSLADNHYNNQR